ncbi:hypothetical protein [Limosilactobacillus walteri]|uniref:Uncharacterized protein n=1 Tax=Limosilactobacillus walteri TaxID=2268022 RepID=A0ABR8P4K8_9LACO|nr:hypothetical protein [Limosilactobacillus walteri]MBD5805941.1 hypothetical protein [Limosilactobacillus walteri]
MSKGILDSVFDKNENRLQNVARIEKSSKGNILVYDLIFSFVNFIFTTIAAFTESKTTLFFTAILLLLNVFPKVFIKTSVYNAMRKNKDSMVFVIFGWLIETFKVISFLFILIIVGWSRFSHVPAIYVVITMGIVFCLGVMDKVVSYLLSNAIDGMEKEE